MGKIKRLPQEIVSKIAAGEVVERPASVVKELIENSLDAFSKEIRIYIEDGGRELIKVSDDGIGIPMDDVELAFERYATSKISSLDDLYNLNTLGFRGEALPSIAEVAIVELITHAKGENLGTRIIINGGKKVHKELGFFGEGTTVIVRSLFYNLPLRRKLLRSSSIEWNKILKIVLSYILAFSNVKFYLYKNEDLFLSSGNTLEDNIKNIFGIEFLKEMKELKFSNNKYELEGFLSFSGKSSGELFIFINNRPVKNDLIRRAITDSLSFPPGKFPVMGFIKLGAKPFLIDPNVHPTKLEIRFLEASEVYTFVYNAIRKAFSIKKLSAMDFRASIPRTPLYVEEKTENSMTLRESLFEYECKEKEFSSSIKVIARTERGYFIAETPIGIAIIDPHALLERLIFERLKSSKVTVQLLVPFVLQFDSYTSSTLRDRIALFKELGFEIEEFGKNAFLLRGVPSPLSDLKINWGEAIKSLLNEGSIDLIKAWADLACHAAPKLGDIKTLEELQLLLDELAQCGNFDLCPHGRPIKYLLTYEEIEKWLRK
ncbi:MAG: DNA mismatch repair endonuclease MutL [Synergistetes bacterium]|nr:DNA mismatch repair endonuclease MutL [Synergistota bacterium]MCX8128235.1 DNA mismatch repair endonuclease MutL [Synergistota bacterium]MDW8192682.1 DNA mismatch repair endonuclease MutL [Synergistota bacterium]